ncbi:tripartite motif-containing protein 16-like [Anguilla anguilla]|uniref:tripartite motif-containing protein 16-like n=1 Tax=Anguilla anguilla TaxID=7936 RepID=UPI0015B20BA5|nr:tripartite motif-containing protein 16-like [Anguilla anguilla]
MSGVHVQTPAPQGGQKGEKKIQLNGGSAVPLISTVGEGEGRVQQDPKSADESKIQEDLLEPEDPGKPQSPQDPKKPQRLQDPGKPQRPQEPEELGGSQDPKKPQRPQESEELGGSQDPKKPQRPQEPEELGGSQDPKKPQRPQEPEELGGSQDPKKPQRPQEPEELGGSQDPKKLQGPQGPEKLEGSQEAPEEPAQDVLGPDDVVCDSCIENPRRALKSCLTCLVSYCQAHLRPHLENPKFQSHRLVEPLRDIERRTCEAHRRPLEFYCRADACCVCSDCAAEEHRGHQTAPVRDARREIEKELSNKQREMLKTMTAAENAINKLQTNTVSIANSVTEVREVIEQQFSELQLVVEQARREVEEVLEAEEKQAVRQAEGIQAHLEQKCGELKKTQLQVERLSRTKHDIDFLTEYSEWQKEKVDVSLPGVYIGLMDRLTFFSQVVTESTAQLRHQLLATYRNKLKDTSKNEKLGIKTTVHAIVSAKHKASQPDPQSREDFMKYCTPLSFDADTVHKFLRLTEENRKVTNTTPWQHSYPDTPERFEQHRQVLAAESFYLGRHYFEVDVSGDGTHLGVTYKSIDRKSGESNGCITGSGFSWCLQWNGRGFSAWHSGVETPLPVGGFTRVGVYVDYARGSLAFYGVADAMTLIHRYQAEFLEPLYPAFWLSKKENVVLLVSPGAPLPLKSPSPPSTPPSGSTTPPAEEQQKS